MFSNLLSRLLAVGAALWRIGTFAVQDFSRNIWLSVVTVTILVLTISSINILVLFDAVTTTAVNLVEQKVDVSVYFTQSAGSEAIGKLRERLLGMSEVKDITFISADEALVNFQKAHAGNELILGAVEELGANPLGASLRIQARQLGGYPAILAALDAPEYNSIIASRDYQDRQAQIEKISAWTTAGRRVVVGLVALFAIISALIVFNAIRITIYTHREEIAIEKLVGAGNWFVTLPFIVESIFLGLISCLVTAIICYPLLGVLQPYFDIFFGVGQFVAVDYFRTHFLAIFGGQFLAITVLTALASWSATRRYLRV